MADENATTGGHKALDPTQIRVKTTLPQLVRWGITLVTITVFGVGILNTVNSNQKQTQDILATISEQGKRIEAQQGQINDLTLKVAILFDRAGISSATGSPWARTPRNGSTQANP